MEVEPQEGNSIRLVLLLFISLISWIRLSFAHIAANYLARRRDCSNFFFATIPGPFVDLSAWKAQTLRESRNLLCVPDGAALVFTLKNADLLFWEPATPQLTRTLAWAICIVILGSICALLLTFFHGDVRIFSLAVLISRRSSKFTTLDRWIINRFHHFLFFRSTIYDAGSFSSHSSCSSIEMICFFELLLISFILADFLKLWIREPLWCLLKDK